MVVNLFHMLHRTTRNSQWLSTLTAILVSMKRRIDHGEYAFKEVPKQFCCGFCQCIFFSFFQCSLSSIAYAYCIPLSYVASSSFFVYFLMWCCYLSCFLSFWFASVCLFTMACHFRGSHLEKGEALGPVHAPFFPGAKFEEWWLLGFFNG